MPWHGCTSLVFTAAASGHLNPDNWLDAPDDDPHTLVMVFDIQASELERPKTHQGHEHRHDNVRARVALLGHWRRNFLRGGNGICRLYVDLSAAPILPDFVPNAAFPYWQNVFKEFFLGNRGNDFNAFKNLDGREVIPTLINISRVIDENSGEFSHYNITVGSYGKLLLAYERISDSQDEIRKRRNQGRPTFLNLTALNPAGSTWDDSDLLGGVVEFDQAELQNSDYSWTSGGH
jgi:hypothetical protein